MESAHCSEREAGKEGGGGRHGGGREKLLSMVEKVYYKYVGEHGQRQGHLGESGVDMTQSCAGWEKAGRGRGEKGARCSSQEVQRFKESGEPKWLDYIGKNSPVPGLKSSG